jgi:hypothetical protein
VVFDADAAIDAGAGGMGGEFLQLLVRIEGEQRDAGGVGAGDGGGLLDGVAASKALPRRTRRSRMGAAGLALTA